MIIGLRFRSTIAVALVFLACWFRTDSWSQIPVPSTPQAVTTTVSVEAQVPPEHKSPRATMGTFLRAINEAEFNTERLKDAIACLDLSEVPPVARPDVGRTAAVQLAEILDRVGHIPWYNYPDEPVGQPFYVLRNPAGDIILERVSSGEWLFGERTVNSLQSLYRAFEDKEKKVNPDSDRIASIAPDLWLRSKFPTKLRQVGFLLEHWQWASLFVLISIGFVFQRTVAFLLNTRVIHHLSRLPGWDSVSQEDTAIGRPVGTLVMAALWWIGLRFVGLPPDAHAYILIVVQVVATVAAARGALKAINIASDIWLFRAQLTATKFDDLFVPLFRSICKTAVIVVALVFLANILYENPTSLLAGLGLGGLAFALAANDILKNLFGSFTLLLDRPFQIGDWVVIEGIEGTVESVGFRTTRIRTFYNSLVTVPNSMITSSSIDNYGARTYRRAKCFLSIEYGTPPEKIEAFCEGLRELVRQHPHTRKDYFHIYFNQFGSASLDIMVYIFFKVPDWGLELKAREEFFLDALRLAEKLGVEFAFPTQTVYLKRGESAGEPDEAFNDRVTARDMGRELAQQIAKASYGDGA